MRPVSRLRSSVHVTVTSLMLSFAAFIALAVAATGCKSMKTGAREYFSKEHSCPEGQISIVARDDLKGSQLVPWPAGSPPAEVKNDPARLAVWQKNRDEESADSRRILDGLDVFEVRGCGKAEYLSCWRYDDQEGSGESGVSCNVGSAMKPNL